MEPGLSMGPTEAGDVSSSVLNGVQGEVRTVHWKGFDGVRFYLKDIEGFVQGGDII